MDASPFVWFGEEVSHLHISVDDCTGMIVGACFDYQETLKGYYEVTAQFLEKYGIPVKILINNLLTLLRCTQNAFEKLDTKLSVNQLLSKHTFRTVSAGHSIKYKNHSYRFIDSNGEQVYLLRNTRVMVIKTRDEQLFASLNNNLYALEVIEEH